MSNIEKIKAEIERQLEYFKGKEDDAWADCDKYTDEDAQWYQGHWKMCSRLLDFIDSLPEEKPSEDLEEAAENLFETIEIQEHENIFEDTFKKIFIAGAERQKAKMMKDAVEGEVIYDLGGFFRIKSEAIDGAKYKVGSWVKLIIVKED